MSQKIILAKENKTKRQAILTFDSMRTTQLSYRWLATVGLIAYYILLRVNIYIYHVSLCFLC